MAKNSQGLHAANGCSISCIMCENTAISTTYNNSPCVRVYTTSFIERYPTAAALPYGIPGVVAHLSHPEANPSGISLARGLVPPRPFRSK